MSIKIMASIWENGPSSQSARFVLIALADFANDDGECWPSMEGIARKVCMTDRGVRKVIRQLEADGWISTMIGTGRKGCNRYLINGDPDGKTRNDVPTIRPETRNHVPPEPRSPGTTVPETRNHVPFTPEPRSAEPSMNHHEPSGERERKPRRAPELPLPDNWIPNDRNVSDAFDRGFSQQEIDHEADRFRDHHLARGSLMRNWDAAWRTWLGNSRRFANGRVAVSPFPGGRGQGRSLASIAAQRRAADPH